MHITPDNGSSSGGIPFPFTSSTDALESLGHIINFIDHWLHCFEDNSGERTGL